MIKKFLANLQRNSDKKNALCQVEFDKEQNPKKVREHWVCVAPPPWVEQVIHP